MAEKTLPSPDVLRQLLRYDPESGSLFWLERGPQWFPDEGHCLTWNARYARKNAMSTPRNGYNAGYVLAQMLYAHRVIWAMQHGEWPSEQIDHINGNRSDNRLGNLRSVSNLENSHNKAVSPRSRSGAAGVLWHKPTGVWRASIVVNHKTIHLGLYPAIADAIAARKAAEVHYGYHKNHGRVINGTDKATTIAGYARHFEAALS